MKQVFEAEHLDSKGCIKAVCVSVELWWIMFYLVASNCLCDRPRCCDCSLCSCSSCEDRSLVDFNLQQANSLQHSPQFRPVEDRGLNRDTRAPPSGTCGFTGTALWEACVSTSEILGLLFLLWNLTYSAYHVVLCSIICSIIFLLCHLLESFLSLLCKYTWFFS